MTAIALQALPRDARYAMRPVRAATSVLRPSFGGPRLPLARKGDHWALEVDPGGLSQECAATLIADLARAAGEPVSLPLPNMGSDAALVSDPAVNGGGQAGSQLALKGFPAGYAIRKGRFFSIIIGGRRYVHIVTAAATASGGGLATVAFWPMLRAAPSNNDVVEFIAPKIQGFVEEGGAFDTDILPMATPKAFTIEERA